MHATDICNMALSYLAMGRIASVDEESETARQCKLHYNHLKKRLLNMYKWNFAQKRVKLAIIDTSVKKWAYAYAYPSKCLHIDQIYNDETQDTKDEDFTPYDVQNINDSTKAILTNVENAWADYTADVDNADIFTPEFVDALAHLLAANMALQLTGSTNLQQMNLQLAQTALEEAKLLDATENKHYPEYPTKYFDSRY